MNCASSDIAQGGRLYWQCRRGMRELDLFLLKFLELGYAQLNNESREHFELLLKTPDPLLLEWLMGRQIPREGELADVVQKMRDAVNHQTATIEDTE
ncbi:MAG: succinate dehydrogenase assembly factor 2 [Gammaproteobacteria bacterium]|nr:succinate dehydrogenase assembly factor 2 [Gammaproteobacteria bacterium]